MLLVKNRGWKNQAGKGLLAVFYEEVVHVFDRLAQGRKVAHQFAAHFEILRTLAGEERHQLAFGVDSRLAVKNAFGVLPGFPVLLLQERDAGLQHFPGFGQGCRYKTEARVLLGNAQRF